MPWLLFEAEDYPGAIRAVQRSVRKTSGFAGAVLAAYGGQLPAQYYPEALKLARALGMNRTERKALLRGNMKFPDLARRIQTEGGGLDVLAFQGVQGLMGGLKECRRATDRDHYVYVQQIIEAVQRSSPLLFDRGPRGELMINSRVAAALLGEDHQAITSRIEALGIDAKVATRPHRR